MTAHPTPTAILPVAWAATCSDTLLVVCKYMMDIEGECLHAIESFGYSIMSMG